MTAFLLVENRARIRGGRLAGGLNNARLAHQEIKLVVSVKIACRYIKRAYEGSGAQLIGTGLLNDYVGGTGCICCLNRSRI